MKKKKNFFPYEMGEVWDIKLLRRLILLINKWYRIATNSIVQASTIKNNGWNSCWDSRLESRQQQIPYDYDVILYSIRSVAICFAYAFFLSNKKFIPIL